MMDEGFRALAFIAAVLLGWIAMLTLGWVVVVAMEAAIG